MPERRIDGYLSRLAQQVDPTALVLDTAEGWVLERAGEAPLGLGESFADAGRAVRTWVAAERARRA